MAVTNSKMRHIECGLRPDTVARLMKSAVALSALSHFGGDGKFCSATMSHCDRCGLVSTVFSGLPTLVIGDVS